MSSCLMKWSHSATTKSWLVSEWQAATDALDEAFVLGFATASHVPGELKVCRDPGRTKEQCRFCEEVQIFFGLEDEIKSFSTTILHEFLQRWADKPWRLRSSSTRKSTQNDRALVEPMPHGVDTGGSILELFRCLLCTCTACRRACQHFQPAGGPP